MNVISMKHEVKDYPTAIRILKKINIKMDRIMEINKERDKLNEERMKLYKGIEKVINNENKR